MPGYSDSKSSLSISYMGIFVVKGYVLVWCGEEGGRMKFNSGINPISISYLVGLFRFIPIWVFKEKEVPKQDKHDFITCLLATKVLSQPPTITTQLGL